MGSGPGLEVVHPMAVVILGGLVTTTFVSLFVLPALYLRFGRRAEPGWLGEDELHAPAGPVSGPSAAAAATRGGQRRPGACDGIGSRRPTDTEKETASDDPAARERLRPSRPAWS